MGLLGRLAGLGRALITRGLAGIGGSAPPVTVSPIVEICVTRQFYAGPAIVRPHVVIAVTRAHVPSVDVRRPHPSGPSVTRLMPSC